MKRKLQTLHYVAQPIINWHRYVIFDSRNKALGYKERKTRQRTNNIQGQPCLPANHYYLKLSIIMSKNNKI